MQLGRVGPPIDVRGSLGLPDLLEKLVRVSAFRRIFRLRALAVDELPKPVL